MAKRKGKISMAKTIVKYNDEYVVPISIDKDFGEFINSIDKEYLDSEGLSRDYLDIIKRFSDYSSANLKDYTVEGNSNALGQKNYMSRSEESGKGIEKLKNYYEIWSQLKSDFGIETANQCIKESIDGSLLVHDMTNGGGVDALYCTTLLAKDVMAYGRPYNDVHSKAPRYADSFIGQIIELIIDASSRYAGAVAIPDINVAFSQFTKKENLSEKQITQLYQRIVHLVNNPYRSGSQSPFFNMSLFTETGLCEAFGGYKYPNGEYAIDYIDEILKNQLIFSKYFGQGIEDSYGVKKPVAFPVVTMNIVRESFKEDYEYIKQILGCYTKFDNINIYIGNADKWASCCYSSDTKVIARDNRNVYFKSFKELYNDNNISKSLKVLSNGVWKDAELVKLPCRDMYKVTTCNGKIMYVTDNHRNNCYDGMKLTKQLTTDDYIMFNTSVLDNISDYNENLTYEQGFAIGTFLEYENNKESDINKTILRTSESKKWIISNINKALKQLNISTEEFINFAKKYISYENETQNKEINMNCLLQSVSFRMGILDGWLAINGESEDEDALYTYNRNIFKGHTSSEKIKDCIELLCTSLGYITSIFVDSKNNGTYNIFVYMKNDQTKNSDEIKIKDNSCFIKIQNIEKIEYSDDVYCFEMKDKANDKFTLPNGIHNYNCRLINDPSKRNSTKKNAMNSFGSGALSEQIVGSSRVVSINLYDIALETRKLYSENLKEKYFEVLKEKMNLGKKILVSQRHLVEKRLNEGFNIFYNIGWIKLDDYFSTYGAGGLHEAAKTICGGNLAEDYSEEELNFAIEIPKFMERYADENSDDFVKLNVEFLTPLESGARRLGKRVDIKYGKKDTFVSNQLLPLTIKSSIDRRLQIENALGGATSAGGILHIGTEGEMPIDIKMRMLEKIITKYPHVEHFAYNKTSSYCEDGHLTLSNVDICPFCHKPIVEKILRVIGYFKPTKNWSAPRQEEYTKRQFAPISEQYDFIKEDNNESKN